MCVSIKFSVNNWELRKKEKKKLHHGTVLIVRNPSRDKWWWQSFFYFIFFLPLVTTADLCRLTNHRHTCPLCGTSASAASLGSSLVSALVQVSTKPLRPASLRTRGFAGCARSASTLDNTAPCWRPAQQQAGPSLLKKKRKKEKGKKNRNQTNINANYTSLPLNPPLAVKSYCISLVL